MGVTMAQMGFFDLSDRYASLDAKKDPLVEIDAVVPWEEFRPTLERVWRKPDAERKSRAGRKPMDAVLMFKTLVLGALYNLSDDQIEYQVRDPAYRSEEMEAKLRGMKLKSHIHRKGKRGKPLTEQAKSSNRTKSSVRARVEHVFGAQTNDMGGTLVRTIGMVRAKAKIGMKNLAYNMRRLGQLSRLNPCPG